MPPTRSRRQGLSRTTAQSPTRSQRAAPSSSRQTYGGSSNQRRRSRHQPQEEEEEDEEEEEEAEEDGEEDNGGDEDAAEGSRTAQVDDDDEEGEEGDDELKVKKRQKLPLSDAVKSVVKGIGRVEIDRKINDLVRLAIFSEYRRVPIKRDDISKKVLGKSAARAFPYVFNRAQAILREVFCFEMVELRAKGTENELLTQAATTSDANKGKKRARGGEETAEKEETARPKGPSSNSWVVRSILPPIVIKAMAEPNAAVAAASFTSADDSSGSGAASTGALLDWQKADGQLGSLGLTFLILSLILLNGRSLSDDQFRALLHRLGLENAAQLPDSLRPDSLAIPPPELDASQSHSSYRRASTRRGGTVLPTDTVAHPSTLQSLLSQMLRQGYLETVKTNIATGAVSRRGGVGRAAGNNRGEGGGAVETIEWKWGPRAEVEIGEEAVATFVRDVYIDADPDNEAAAGTARGGSEEADSSQTQVDSSRFVGRSSGRQSRSGPRASIQANNSSSGARGRASAAGAQGDKAERERREKQSQMLRREIERAAGSQLIS
ncbi:MAGE-domain-containing protein [Microstroma glucosiphilum]|uniref:MAGE-domain-containing protein n=1 Tax=Pseudomicrostroma glucosiphilum TaxID=1684307 RepID=A0A316U7G9_9BASI|nr:MAGE-domain-containing protein [Pseudomicrostroma glucosiphilum]PWN20778.1 MAGE-domain-containing protein [Pseudomicrostroma glucosiphilum]